MSSRLSPLAQVVLDRHGREPDRPIYALAVLGSMFNDQAVDRLDGAYHELEAAGLVERVGGAVRLFNDFKPLFKLVRSEPVGGEVR